MVAIRTALLLATVALAAGEWRPPVQEDLKLALVNNRLSHRLLSLLGTEDPNLFFSPLGLGAALGALYGATAGVTRREISDLLGMDWANFHDVHEGFRNYISRLPSPNRTYDLSLSTGAWIDRSLSVRESYQNMLKAYYFSEVRPADFASDGETVRKDINAWVADRTHGMIKDMLTENPDPLVKLIFLNALYFKGTWEKIFDKNFTKPAKFYSFADKTRPVPIDMMEIKHTYPYLQTDTFQAVKLPYKGDKISMLVVLPNEGTKIETVQDYLTPEVLDKHLQEMKPVRVALSLPKFKMSYSKKMASVLESLGLKTLFNEAADLSGLTEKSRGLYVSAVTQRAVVEVDEKGTEASAVTELEVSLRMGFSGKRVKADRPFLFYIVDDRFRLVLFTGRLQDPSAL